MYTTLQSPFPHLPVVRLEQGNGWTASIIEHNGNRIAGDVAPSRMRAAHLALESWRGHVEACPSPDQGDGIVGELSAIGLAVGAMLYHERALVNLLADDLTLPPAMEPGVRAAVNCVLNCISNVSRGAIRLQADLAAAAAEPMASTLRAHSIWQLAIDTARAGMRHAAEAAADLGAPHLLTRSGDDFTGQEYDPASEAGAWWRDRYARIDLLGRRLHELSGDGAVRDERIRENARFLLNVARDRLAARRIKAHSA